MPTKVPTFGARERLAVRRRAYNRLDRDRASTAFYHSAAWQRCRRAKLALTPQCESCFARGDLAAATVVHHRIELGDDRSLAFDLDNLQSLCASCHSSLHFQPGKSQ